jgi:hypothetical protein
VTVRGWMGDTSGGPWGPDDGPDEGEKDHDRALEQVTQQHELDEDACCIRCGFDAAEWWHLERQKPEGERDPQPECTAVGK